MVIWKRWLPSNKAIFGIYVQFLGGGRGVFPLFFLPKKGAPRNRKPEIHPFSDQTWVFQQVPISFFFIITNHRYTILHSWCLSEKTWESKSKSSHPKKGVITKNVMTNSSSSFDPHWSLDLLPPPSIPSGSGWQYTVCIRKIDRRNPNKQKPSFCPARSIQRGYVDPKNLYPFKAVKY